MDDIVNLAREVFIRGKSPIRGCLFCAPHRGMIIEETERFRVLADTHPIIPGHIMISSKAHYGAMGEMPISWIKECEDLRNICCEKMKRFSDGVISYEHGKAGSCHSSSEEEVQCEHFHLHLLPSTITITEEVGERFPSVSISSYEGIHQIYMKYGSYLFFETSEGEKRVYPADEDMVPSHFLRTLVCRKLGIANLSEWENYDDLDRYIESRKYIQMIFSSQEAPYALSR